MICQCRYNGSVTVSDARDPSGGCTRRDICCDSAHRNKRYYKRKRTTTDVIKSNVCRGGSAEAVRGPRRSRVLRNRRSLIGKRQEWRPMTVDLVASVAEHDISQALHSVLQARAEVRPGRPPRAGNRISSINQLAWLRSVR